MVRIPFQAEVIVSDAGRENCRVQAVIGLPVFVIVYDARNPLPQSEDLANPALSEPTGAGSLVVVVVGGTVVVVVVAGTVVVVGATVVVVGAAVVVVVAGTVVVVGAKVVVVGATVVVVVDGTVVVVEAGTVVVVVGVVAPEQTVPLMVQAVGAITELPSLAWNPNEVVPPAARTPLYDSFVTV